MGTTLVSKAHLTGHHHTKCEDKSAYRRTPYYDICVLCDGAGSAKYGATGAKYTAQFVASKLHSILRKNQFSNFKEFLQKAPSLITQNIQTHLRNTQNTQELQHFASTLLFALYSKRFDRWLIGHIGDGAIAGYKNNTTVVLSAPKNGEFINETYFITQKDASSNLRIQVYKKIDGVLLLSDGACCGLYSNAKKSFAPGVKKFFVWQKEYGEQKCSMILYQNLFHISAKKTNDDCSMILLQRG